VRRDAFSGQLEGRLSLVTGGSRGIGRAVAIGLATAGSDVAIVARDEGSGRRVCEDIVSLGRRSEFYRCDVRSPKQVEMTVAEVAERFGKIDILVTCAGITGKDGSPEGITIQEWGAVLDTNLTGTFLFCREVGKLMLVRGRGVIVNVASIAAESHLPGQLAYCVSKAGVAALTRGLGQEWAPRGIRVVAIAPGYVQTDMNRTVWEPLARYLEGGKICPSDAVYGDESLSVAYETYSRTAGRAPLGRYGKPEEVAAFVVFLTTDCAAFATGAMYYIDGGYLVRP
jgi:NAD(P)-dependent dehydrogenase (short-subunit alcohol dehydrogenase family)